LYRVEVPPQKDSIMLKPVENFPGKGLQQSRKKHVGHISYTGEVQVGQQSFMRRSLKELRIAGGQVPQVLFKREKRSDPPKVKGPELPEKKRGLDGTRTKFEWDHMGKGKKQREMKGISLKIRKKKKPEYRKGKL